MSIKQKLKSIKDRKNKTLNKGEQERHYEKRLCMVLGASNAVRGDICTFRRLQLQRGAMCDWETKHQEDKKLSSNIRDHPTLLSFKGSFGKMLVCHPYAKPTKEDRVYIEGMGLKLLVLKQKHSWYNDSAYVICIYNPETYVSQGEKVSEFVKLLSL